MPAKKQQTEQNCTALTEQKQTKPKRKSPPRPEQAGITNPGDNTKYIMSSWAVANMPKFDMNDPKQVEKRVYDYFMFCAEQDIKPSLPGMAAALQIDRRRLWEIRENVQGRNTYVTNDETREVLKKATRVLELILVEYSQNGKMNPAIAIFLLKNGFGYSDTQEIVVAPADPLGEKRDPAELNRFYSESMVPDA